MTFKLIEANTKYADYGGVVFEFKTQFDISIETMMCLKEDPTKSLALRSEIAQALGQELIDFILANKTELPK